MQGLNKLSRKELFVFHLHIDGYSNHEIALKLFVQEKTVKAHNSSIFRKLGFVSIKQMIIAYYKELLVSTQPGGEKMKYYWEEESLPGLVKVKRPLDGQCCGKCGQWMSEDLVAEKRKLRSERSKAILAERRAAGVTLGRPTLNMVGEAYALHQRGKSLRFIANKLKCSTNTVQAMLKRAKSLG